MGSVYSHITLRYFMNVGAVISVVATGSVICMATMLEYYGTENNRTLIVLLGLFFSLLLLGGTVMFFEAIRFIKDFMEDDVKRVRFSSQVEIYGGSDQSIYEGSHDNPGHAYEEIRPCAIYNERSVDREQNPDKGDLEDKPGLSLNSEHDNTVISSTELCQSPTANDGTLLKRSQNTFRKRGKIALEGGNNYGTCEKSRPISFDYSNEVFEDDDGEEVVI